MRMFYKRAIKRLPAFLLLLLVPWLALGISTKETQPPAGFYLPEDTPSAERIRDYLEENGFVPAEGPQTLVEQVCLGELDCGVVFPENFAEKVAQGQLKESLEFYAAPSSFSPDLYKSHVAAIVFREYVPYICASAFAETAVTQEEVLAEYEEMFAKGHVFSFRVVAADQSQNENIKNRSMVMGTTAIVAFAALFVLAAESADRAVSQMLRRLGVGKTLTRVLLPETAVNLLLAVIFMGAGLAAAGLPELMLPAAIYCTAVWGWGLVFYAGLWSAKKLYVLLPVPVIASAALCPIYTDLSILLPWLNRVRMVLPAYWLWCIPDAFGTWVVLCLGVLAAGVLFIALRCRWILKYK